MTIDVLLLEDDPAKKAKLLAFFDREKGRLFGRVDTAICVADARGFLRERRYDLLIADIVVPAVLGGALDERHSIDLFIEIDEGAVITPPRYSLAISAVTELSQESRDFFIGRPWGILPYSDSNGDCLLTVEKICQYILAAPSDDSRRMDCEVVVITALMDPEYTAVENCGVVWDPLEPFDDVQFVRYGHVVVDGRNVTIAAAFAPRMGAVASAVLVSKLAMHLKPKLFIMCGICAGLPDKTQIGDVVAAESSWDWQSGKYVDRNGIEQFEIGPYPISIDEQSRAQLMLLRRDSAFWDSLAKLAVHMKLQIPRLLIGPAATGSSVLADQRVVERIKATQHRALIGLDMEVYGVYVAVQSCAPGARFLSLKAVCDHGDKQKVDEYQEYASTISAKAMLQFLVQYAGPLLAK